MKYGFLWSIIVLIMAHQRLLPAELENQQRFLYAPTRGQQVAASKASSLLSQTGSCKLCKAVQLDNNPNEFPLARTHHFTVMLNIYPYAKGHLLIVANDHGSMLDTLTQGQQFELIALLSAASKVLKTVFNCQGINIGYNEGVCAGASVPNHLHVHILPRYDRYEKGFIQATANTQLVEWSLKEIQQQLLPYFESVALMNKVV